MNSIERNPLFYANRGQPPPGNKVGIKFNENGATKKPLNPKDKSPYRGFTRLAQNLDDLRGLIDVAERYSERMLGDFVYRLWDVKQAGLTADAIGLKVGRSETVVRRHSREDGGVLRPRGGRELSGRALSMSERESILALEGQRGVREIARRLGFSPSTISRELR